MINKKNVLGKTPQELGDKDAIHVAIVAVRAGRLICPGQRCGLNEFNEAVPSGKGVGVADPFRKSNILVGQNFWLILDQDSVPNVQHVWEHPTVNFATPTRPAKLNQYLQESADNLGITYDELMIACGEVAKTDRATAYPASGTKSKEDVQIAMEEKVERWELWSEWSSETGYEFPNNGTECCPEYEYPEILFT